MAEEFIQSRQNPRVKALAKLQERSGRRKLGLFTVEGLREISRCADLCGLDEIYFCPEFFKSQEHFKFIESARKEKYLSAGCPKALLKKFLTAKDATV